MADVFLDVVTRGLNFIYSKGRLGYWSDPRTTAEVILTLSAAGEISQSEYVTAASDYLLSQYSTEVVGGSWGSELWDTSLVVSALHKTASNSVQKRQAAIEWMVSRRFSDGSYDGEPWDTLFASLALLETGRKEVLLQSPTLDWLCGLQNQDGSIISSHYTGLFLQVLGKSMRGGELDRVLRSKLESARIKALLYLSETYREKDLWSVVNWCNAYIVDGVASVRHKQLIQEIPKLLTWFEKNQAENGSWDDVVRTAITVRALCHLKIAHEIVTFDPLQPLDREVYIQTVQTSLARAIQTRLYRPQLALDRPLFANDEVSGNLIITVTPKRKLVFSALAAALGVLWAIVTNWASIRSLFGR